MTMFNNKQHNIFGGSVVNIITNSVQFSDILLGVVFQVSPAFGLVQL